MYKYRRLTIEELRILEKQFIRFLATQSITGEDWKKIQTEEKERQDDLIDQFSDVVIEKTLHNVKILEQRTARRIVYFQFFEEHAEVLGLEFESKIPLDLTGEFQWSDLLKILDNDECEVDFLSGKKSYTKDRMQEIFEILDQGSRIVTDEKIFNSMLNLFNK